MSVVGTKRSTRSELPVRTWKSPNRTEVNKIVRVGDITFEKAEKR
jgi:hypothetical protein